MTLWGEASAQVKGEEIHLRVISETNGREVLPWRRAEGFVDGEADTLAGGRRWTARLEIPVGGPYRLETCLRSSGAEFADAVSGDSRRHLFAGDLFLIGGQSNGAGYARDGAEDGPCVGISVLRLNGQWDLASHPLNDATDCIRANRDVPVTGHGPWLAFAKTLYRETGIPVGLLPGALGGSPMEAWMPGAALYENALKLVKEAGKIRGVLWYQGCSDALAGNSEGYRERFLTMADRLRKDTGIPELAFFTCQLNGFAEPGTSREDLAWAQLRRAQEEAAEEENIWMLPTAGMRLGDVIHNNGRTNLRIGGQIGAQALHLLYGRNVRWEPPAIVEVKAQEGQLCLTLSPVEGELRARAGVGRAFAAWRGEERLRIRQVRTEKNRLILTGEKLHLAERLEYAQTRDLRRAGIYDRTGGWMLAPFQITMEGDREK